MTCLNMMAASQNFLIYLKFVHIKIHNVIFLKLNGYYNVSYILKQRLPLNVKLKCIDYEIKNWIFYWKVHHLMH
jgi:hypothetical protein